MVDSPDNGERERPWGMDEGRWWGRGGVNFISSCVETQHEDSDSLDVFGLCFLFFPL